MNMMYAIVVRVLWVVFGFFHPWRTLGNPKLPEGGVVICGNHTTLSDPIYVALALGVRNQIRVMAKAELLRIPVLGFILKRAGIIGVERGKADVGAIKASLKALHSGQPLLLFPEGTRVEKGQEGDAHSGAAMLATRTGVPLMPVYIPRKKKWFRRTTIVFGEPYMPTFEGRRATPEDYRRISVELMEKIYALEDQTA